MTEENKAIKESTEMTSASNPQEFTDTASDVIEKTNEGTETSELESTKIVEEEPVQPVKRRRGRPRKNPVPEQDVSVKTTSTEASKSTRSSASKESDTKTVKEESESSSKVDVDSNPSEKGDIKAEPKKVDDSDEEIIENSISSVKGTFLVYKNPSLGSIRRRIAGSFEYVQDAINEFVRVRYVKPGVGSVFGYMKKEDFTSSEK